MSNERSPTQYLGVRAIRPPDLTLAKIAPPAGFRPVVKGQLYLDTVAGTAYMWSGTTWISLGSGTTGAIVTLTGGSGGAISPVAGDIDLLGTANQITTTGTAGTITWSLPAAITAPGSLTTTTTLAATTTITAGTGITATTGNIVSSTGNITSTLGSVGAATTVTAGTSMTATLGNITATNGNLVATAAGTGLLFTNSPTATGVAASPLVVNGRSGQAIFSSVSIAAAADLTLTITNSSITALTTQVIYSMSGATTGSALSIKSVTNSAGSSAIVVTNGTGATTTTANITLNFIVVN